MTREATSLEKKHRKKALQALAELGRKIVEDIRSAQPPKLKIPSRSTANIIYDRKNRYFVLGPRYGIRSAGSMKQVKKVAQLLCTAEFAKELIESGKFATLREMYYTAEGWEAGPFHDQSESDAIIEDLEATFGLKRESLGLMPEEDGAAVYGQIVFREGDVTIDATKAGRGGYTIPPTIDDVEFVKCRAKRIIAVETMGMYHRLIQEEAWKKFDALIVGLKGQAARATRRFLKRANEELGLPVYLNCDGDPFGYHIGMVIISGSANLAYINHELAVPDAKYIGVTASDIVNYKLPTDKLRELDIARLKQLLKDPRYNTEFWQSEIKKMLEIGRKAEQQAFAKYGLAYVVNEYLPAKLKEVEKQQFLGTK
ncbi:MAG: DNA topoisomerase IV subunit A [Candidatus Hadarchaeum sp.]|uniref:DNA topoisomerase IV subunit A n=1 Tax=Candidatus Hadarchaeum sp. TaxID=2883567 RepID=UPI003D148B84